MLFSIGLPAYKSKFLSECIESILYQTYKTFELIIINDCSPEPIDEIVSRYADQRIKYLKNEVNIGAENLVNNWNNCLKEATGDYFIMMGDDDKLEPNYLEEFNLLILRYPKSNVYHCRSKIIDENSTPIGLTPSRPEWESVYDSIWHRISGFRLQYISDFVYRTKTLKENGGFYYMPLAWSADDITSYIAGKDHGIAHTNLTVFNYRETRFTLSSSGSFASKMKAVVLEKKWFNDFLTEVPCNQDDQVIYGQLLQVKDGYIQRKKTDILRRSLKLNFSKNLKYWYENRKQYDIPVAMITKSALAVVKNKMKL